MNDIARQLNAVKSTLPAGVALVAVSKFHPVETLREAYDILSEKNLSDAEKDALRTYFDGADALAFGNFDTKDLNLAKLNDGLRKLVTVLQK